MLRILEGIIEVIKNVPDYILYAIETAVNGWFRIIEALLVVAGEALGELPEVTSVPEYVGEINWFYPVGTMLAIATPLLTGYVAWLGISYIYRKFGAI
jgi:hypothetical protein